MGVQKAEQTDAALVPVLPLSALASPRIHSQQSEYEEVVEHVAYGYDRTCFWPPGLGLGIWP